MSIIKKRPKIGIPGWRVGDNSFGATIAYLNYLSNFGDVQILTPMEGIVKDLDLVVLPGGKDTPSYLYGQMPHFMNSDSDQFKEAFVRVNLQQYIDAGIGVFGICLGLQQLVVFMGGELCQHIPSSHGYSEESRSELVHELMFTAEYKKMEMEVLVKRKAKVLKGNSLHHQGAYMSMVPDCFDIICHTKDNIAEIIKHKELPIAAIQGHPEEDWNPVATKLINELIKRSPNLTHEEHTRSDSKLSD